MHDYKDDNMGHGTVYGGGSKTPNMGKAKPMGKKSGMGKSKGAGNMGKSMGKDCK